MHRIKNITRSIAAAVTAVFLSFATLSGAVAAPLITSLPLGEQWFGIQVDSDQVGFYRQRTTRLPDGGYRIEGDGSVKMKVMGFTKEATSREIYLVSAGLALKSFEVEQTIGGTRSRLSGRAVSGGLQVRRETGGSSTEKLLKAKGEVFPGPVLNQYPLIRDFAASKVHRILTFDPEEVKIKEVSITVLGEGATPEGAQAVRLRNNLYPFVNNDIWVDRQGNTLLESVRDGLVLTRAEQPGRLAAVVSGVALAQKDLIYDFSMVRAEPALRLPPARLAGLSVAVDGYGAQLPLVTDGWQLVERSGERVVFRTGTLRALPAAADQPDGKYLAAAEGIEAAAPVLVSRARELVAGKNGAAEQARALSGWTAKWLTDTVDDSGSALTAFQKKNGNCQSHAKLYTALARAAGIPTRFVSGLVSQDGKGFLYHSWAESWIDGRWVAVDPTFDQLPADPTHLAMFEGHSVAELSPLVGIIGKIRVSVLEEK